MAKNTPSLLVSTHHLAIISIITALPLTFLGLLLCGGLGGHVDGCRSHRDGAPPGHQVELHSFPGDESGRHLHLFGQAQVWAEAGHEVSGGDEVHAGLQCLQDQLEAPADLLLGDPRDGADFCEGKENGSGEVTYLNGVKWKKCVSSAFFPLTVESLLWLSQSIKQKRKMHHLASFT